ncbi:MAG: hypothetical protein ABW346_02260 [Terrimicrobium sp.]
MPEPVTPNPASRSAGGRRAKLLLVVILALLALGIPFISIFRKPAKEGPKDDLHIVPGGPPTVMQMRATDRAARAENSAYVLSLNQEVYVDVRSPGIWLLQLMNALGKQDLDPRSKITLDTVVFDPVTEKDEHAQLQALREQREMIRIGRQELEAMPDGREKTVRAGELTAREAALNKDVDQLLLHRRSAAWDQFLKDTLERSCLVVNGRVFPDLNAQFAYDWHEYSEHKNTKGEYDHDQYVALRFKVLMTEDNKPQWLELLGGTGFARKPINVSVAMVDLFERGNTEIMPTAINPSNNPPEWQRVSLKASTDWLTWLLLECFFLLFLVFLYYAFATKVLRDMAPDGLWHLSLARCQMAFWFFIVAGCYIFLWIVTGDYRTLTTQELLLLSLSSATGLGAFLITDESDAATPRGAGVLTKDELSLENPEKLQALALSEGDIQKRAGLTEAEILRSQERIAELERRAAYYKKGWRSALRRSLNDLLSESNDGRPSFYRFQMIGWNFAFGVIFVRAVYYKLAMPEFSSDQLLLMGISNGTYLGFKWSAVKTNKIP